MLIRSILRTRSIHYTTTRRIMTSSAIPHSPPSPASSNSGERANKRPRITSPVPAAVSTPIPATTDSSTPATTSAAPPQHPNKKRASKKERKRITPIDPVLKVDILNALGWTKLPTQTFPPSEAEKLGNTLWPKTTPRDIQKATKEAKRTRGRGRKFVEEAGASADEEGEGATGESSTSPWKFTEAEFTVVGLTSHGDGIAVYPVQTVAEDCPKPQWAIIIPFTYPGETVRAKVTRNLLYHSFAEPVNTPSSSSLTSTPSSSFPIPVTRDTSLVGCQYFGSCGGCQYQDLPYSTQLELKRLVLQKAMRNFSGIPEGTQWTWEGVGETIPSPKQYGYRTKITPHFELPKYLQTGKKGRQAAISTTITKVEDVVDEEEAENEGLGVEVATSGDAAVEAEEVQAAGTTIPSTSTDPATSNKFKNSDFPVGFNQKCRPAILDIEECPIATPIINAHMPKVRKEVKEGIGAFKRGATLLFRDSLVLSEGVTDGDEANGQVEIVGHECITKHSETITERVGDTSFQFPAGSFFQNNASILPSLVGYVKTQVEAHKQLPGEESYLVDAYCGSGLFSLCLADCFTKVLGIEIDPQSITHATKNATLNKITNATFLPGSSETIFDPAIKNLKWDPEKTTLIVDPPRKGCDDGFLSQVVHFRPRYVVYVSCNVHTMAENVGTLIRLTAKALEAEGKDPEADGYKIQSLRAIDLFPQTHHAEGLLVLRRN